MEQNQKTQQPVSPPIQISIDMTVGDDSSATRLAKVKHQGLEETVRVLNRVLRKMNAGMKIKLEKVEQHPLLSDVSSPDPPDEPGDIDYSAISEEPVAVTRA